MKKSFKNILFGTLRGRLILNVVLIHAVMMTVFIADLTIRQRAVIIERQEEDVMALSNNLSINAAEWILAKDVEGLQELVDAEKTYPEMNFTIITDNTGRILAHSDKSRIGQQLLELPDNAQQTIINQTSQLVDALTPVMVEGKLIGWVRIGLGQQKVSKKLDEIIVDGIIYTLAAIFIGSLLAWIVGTRFTKRLYDIQSTINQVAAGNTKARTKITGTDEAAILAKEFNEMLDVRIKSRIELQEKNKLLEDYRFALDQSAIVSVTDENGIILSVNDNFCKISKYTREELIGKTHSIVNSKYHSADLFNNLWATISEGKVWRGEIKNKNKDGEYYWLDGTIVPFLNQVGKPFQYLGIRYDITKRKIAEELFKEKSAQLQMLSNNLPDSMIYQLFQDYDGKAEFTYISESSLNLLGVSPEEILRDSSVFYTRIHNDDKQKFYDARSVSVSEMSILNVDIRIYDSPESFKWCNIHSIPQKSDDGRIKWNGILINISERKKAEELIKEKSIQLEMLSNNLPDSMMYQLVSDDDGGRKFTFISKSVERLLGKTAEEIIRDSSILYNLTYDEDKQMVADAEEIAARNMTEYNVEVRSYNASGELKWWHVRSTPRRLNDGKVVWDGIQTDITERKKMEEILSENEQMLKTIFENSPIGKEVFDKEGFLIKANHKVGEIFGTDADALINVYNIKNDPNFQYNDVWEKLEKGFDVKHEIELDFSKVQYKTSRKGIGYLELTITPIPDKISKNIGYIIQVLDITERKQYDNKIAKAIIKTQEDERYEIGGELHDNVCQILVAAQMGLGMLNKNLVSNDMERLEESKRLVGTAIDDLRNLSHRLAPVFYSVANLEESFKKLIYTYHFSKHTRTSLQVEIDEEKYNLSSQLQLNLYRILQEQLNNIYKYANATVIDIDLKIVNSKLRMIIMDNGIGFDMNAHIDGIGFANMRRRVEIFSGKFEILTSPDNGCLIRINIPVEENVITDQNNN